MAGREGKLRRAKGVLPLSMMVLGELSGLVRESGGVSLLVDYGYSGPLAESTLRGFSRQRVVSPLERPGESDLTADVNFGAITTALADSGVLHFGPKPQAEFLTNLGIAKRQEMLLSKARNEAERRSLERCYSVMMKAEEMGERFKVLALFPATAAEIMQLRSPPGPSGFACLPNPT